ncbi:MAG TPA: magnesium chelatase [Rikenellaceae bacterium]|nr:magnesium chelatase [Rikenellaceae bacterium]
MLTRIHSAKCIGIEAVDVTVETNVDRGIGIHLVGMADTAVKESLLRVVTAMSSLGYKVPGKKIVINLAPADLRKSGSGYDLPIAAGIISSASDMALPFLDDYLIMGELSLDGGVRYIPGALLYAEFARAKGLKGVILPYDCASEACAIEGIEIFGVRTLTEVMSVLSGDIDVGSLKMETIGPIQGDNPKGVDKDWDIPDFADIVGQHGAKRALEIAAAGGGITL